MTSAGFAVLVGEPLAEGSLARAWSGLRSPQAANAYAAITVHTMPAIRMTGNRSERLD